MILSSPLVLQRLLPCAKPAYHTLKLPWPPVLSSLCTACDFPIVLAKPLPGIDGGTDVSSRARLNPVDIERHPLPVHIIFGKNDASDTDCLVEHGFRLETCMTADGASKGIAKGLRWCARMDLPGSVSKNTLWTPALRAKITHRTSSFKTNFFSHWTVA